MVQSQTIAASKVQIELKPQWCKGCYLCVGACVRDVLDLNVLGKVQVEQPEKCTGCGLCEATCPDYAIRVIKNA